jgi:hypothetical protein
VLPAQLLIDLLTTRLAAADPDITEIRLHDPRESDDSPPPGH